MNTEVQTIVKTSLSLDRNELLSKFFPNSSPNETYTLNDKVYTYLSSGSTRHVYVDPTLTYVIKVPYSDYGNDAPSLGNKFNIIEVCDYVMSQRDNNDGIPKVRSMFMEWDGNKCIIKQDFLFVMNIGRVTINPIFDGIFEPSYTNLAHTYGFQYGWNNRTQRIELYDTSDAYISNDWLGKEFDECRLSRNFDSENAFDFMKFFKKIDFINKMHLHLNQPIMKIHVKEWKRINEERSVTCFLSHQNGIRFITDDPDNLSLEFCGTAKTGFNTQFQNTMHRLSSEYKFNIDKVYM